MNKKLLSTVFISLLMAVSSCTPTSNNKVTGIEVINPINSYYLYDEFIAPSVIASYSNGTTKDVRSYATYSGYDMNTIGEYTVTVTYQSFTDTYEMSVNNKLVSLSISSPVVEYMVGDEFEKPVVTANYLDGTHVAVTNNVTFSGFDMNTVGPYTVVVSYQNVSTSYSIEVKEHVSKPQLVSLTVNSPKVDYYVGELFVTPSVTATYDNNTTKEVGSLAEFSGYNMLIVDSYTVTVSYENVSTTFNIEVKNRPITYKEVDVSLDLPSLIGNEEFNEFSRTYSEIVFTFSKGSGSNKPKSDKSNGGFIALYTGNTLTISGKLLKSISFDYVGGKTGEIVSDCGEISISSTTFSWSGENNSVVLTANAQVRFKTINITYLQKEGVNPEFEGVQTIKEVLDAAKLIEYTPNNSGWYLSDVSVSVLVEAIDAIDSVSTGKEYDGNARGKVLVCDETGTIICSSSTSTNNPISFYHRVKEYIKAGTTQYLVEGHIAFFNGVTEIKVDNYEYQEDLVISKNYESYVDKTYTKSEEFVNDVISNVAKNYAGYGVGGVVKMSGLTYLNKYNSAGSYLFIDQEGNLVPVYSLLDKDRSLLQEGKCYDIIGLESAYKYRPSLRILKASLSSLDATSFDFRNNVTEVTNLQDFYNIGMGENEAYVRSELTVYKADVYVSSYADDKYTFNTQAYYIGGSYTTGNSQTNAASLYSLGIFNEDLDYKQTFLDYLLENCKSIEDLANVKLTLYFTLAYLDIVDGKNMWRVNVFEDLVNGLDYYDSSEASMIFDTSKSTCDREDGIYQTWSNINNSIVVTNESTDTATVSRKTDYLKIVDGTKLTITFDSDIIAFTLYTGTYSSIASFGAFSGNIKAYEQRKDHTTVFLKEKSKTIVIDTLGVSGATYLKVDSITINY